MKGCSIYKLHDRYKLKKRDVNNKRAILPTFFVINYLFNKKGASKEKYTVGVVYYMDRTKNKLNKMKY